jgi:hypothetical protein
MYPWGVRLPIVVYNVRNATLVGIWLLMLFGPTDGDDPLAGGGPSSGGES